MFEFNYFLEIDHIPDTYDVQKRRIEIQDGKFLIISTTIKFTELIDGQDF